MRPADVLPESALDTGEAGVVRALRRGDEAEFARLVDELSPAMLRVATARVGTGAVGEEVVQETWLAVIKGIDRFQGRSSLKTWIFRILSNIAATRGSHERRSVPFSGLAQTEAADGPVLEPERFLGPDHDRYPGHWAIGPTAWPTPEDGLMRGETREVIIGAVNELPPAQRSVIALRDIYGWPADEVCDALELSDGNQRVLLHRARTKVRKAIEGHFGAVEPTLPEVVA